MLFTSAVFLARFLPVVLVLDRLLERLAPPRARFAALLLASLFFYGWWRADHLLVLCGSVAANYALGRAIEAAAPGGRRALLWLGVGLNLLLLAGFKYAVFLAANLLPLGGAEWAALVPAPVALPLGISFFTFTQITYLRDCREGRRGDHGPVEYALFVAFFPHLLAGPIIHHAEMIPQFRRPARGRDETLSDLATGAALLAVGAAKKLLLADPLAPVADAAFTAAGHGAPMAMGAAWLGAAAYALQLYFDFSGYSDMALGLARMFGVRFPVNFDSPYKAADIVDFWRRWHVTLSRWLRENLYVPLGGNRRGALARHRNLLATMLLGGLWHGAHWNFVIWGGLHGLALVACHLWRARVGPPAGRAAPLRALAARAATLAFVVLAWVFFRAETTQGALHMVAAMLGLGGAAPRLAFLDGARTLLAGAGAVALLAPNSNALLAAIEARRPAGYLAAALAGAAAAGALLAAVSGAGEAPFLYFNF